ncbi:MAG TPA: efflux RND transporter periplasmic adaptor subunit [Propionicimonas sp.]|jgi:HlyD family secretion protein
MAGEKRKHPPIPVIVVVLALLIGGGVWWWWSSTQPTTAGAQEQVSGSVEANEYQVAAALSGRITSVLVAEGDKVTKGQELIRLDRSATKLVLDQAKQGVTAAKAALTNAKDDNNSTKADVTAARARLKQAEAAVKLAQVQLGYTIVTAPRDGTVVSVTTNTGQNAGPGKTLLTMIDPTDLFVRVFVPETEIGKVKNGQAATVVTDSSTTTYQGTVSFIASQSEFTPNNVQTKDQRVKLVYEVRVRISDSTGTLKAGMPVDVTFA